MTPPGSDPQCLDVSRHPQAAAQSPCGEANNQTGSGGGIDAALPRPTQAPVPPRPVPEFVALPTAALKAERRASWLWFAPLLAACAAGWIGYQAWKNAGVTISVQLDRGHGLEPGDDVRYRGIAIGTVRDVDLAPDAQSVVVTARLRRDAAPIATAGARFWVVRPQIGPAGIAGLETVVGPRYLAALPGSGAPQRTFVGLTEPPIIEAIEPGDLEIVLQSPRRIGIRAGSPVLYRQVEVGRILSVGLTSDGGAVEVRLHIQRAYAPLIRPETRFWSAGGLDARVGLSGMTLQVESVESFLGGGVSLATPPAHGSIVRNGHRFQLDASPQDEWLKWQPLVAIGSSSLPPGALQPTPLRAALGWKQGGLIRSEKSARGWVIQTDDGILGPANLLVIQDDVDRRTVVLEVAGQPLPLADGSVQRFGGLARLNASVGGPRWPRSGIRVVDQPEDCLIVGDAAGGTIPLATSKLAVDEEGWRIDPSIPLDESWHGACVLARSDGALVGLVLVEKNRSRVALVPRDPSTPQP